MSAGVVFVVEDDRQSEVDLVSAFEAEDFAVHVASSGVAALGEATFTAIDVVIVDLDLVDLDGLEVCRHLRCRTRLPIIALSGVDSDARKIAVLDAGADDCLTKPISMPELMARTRVAVRHRRELAIVPDDEMIAVGTLRMDVAAREARLIDRSVMLTAKEFDLLAVLARNPSKVVPHRLLLDKVWGAEASMETLRTHVCQLRRKLGGDASSVILRSRPGVGYQLQVRAGDLAQSV